jgi:hypothetical protein
VHDVGGELSQRRDVDPKTDDTLALRPERPPDLAVVECDWDGFAPASPVMVPACTGPPKAGAKPRTPV